MWIPDQVLSANERLITSNQLELNMSVVRLEIPWDETPFTLQGFRITHPDQIARIREISHYVVINDNHKPKPNLASVHSIDDINVTRKRRKSSYSYQLNPVSRPQLQSAQQSYLTAEKSFRRLEEQLNQGQKLELGDTTGTVKSMMDSLLQHPSAMLWMTRIHNRDRYTVEHSLNVAILAMTLGVQLGFDQPKLQQLGIAGMLHDLGKIFVREEVLNKPGVLTGEEFDHIRKHPTWGFELIQNDNLIDWRVMDAVLHHHERIDGQGYPHGLLGHQIDQFAKIIAIVDAFDAMTSQRPYNTQRTTQEALSVLYNFKGTQFDEHLVNTFIEIVGIYPEGSIVELNNGEVGIVVATNQLFRLQPAVLVIMDQQRQRIPEKIKNLRNYQDSEGSPTLRIVRSFVDGTFGLYAQHFVSGPELVSPMMADQHPVAG